MSIDAVPAAEYRSLQHRAAEELAKAHLAARLLHLDLHHVRVPRNLGEQSEAGAHRHVGHGRRVTVGTSDARGLVAEDFPLAEAAALQLQFALDELGADLVVGGDAASRQLRLVDDALAGFGRQVIAVERLYGLLITHHSSLITH